MSSPAPPPDDRRLWATLPQLAEEFGVNAEQLRQWLKPLRQDPGNWRPIENAAVNEARGEFRRAAVVAIVSVRRREAKKKYLAAMGLNCEDCAACGRIRLSDDNTASAERVD